MTTVGSTSRRADIQGLRGIAVLLVVLFHAGLPLPGGFIGVDIFFVISGFVITAMLMREWNENHRISLGQFYIRRFKRLTPALAVMVTVVVAAAIVIQSPFGIQQMTAITAAGAVLLVANFAIAATTGGYFGATAESNPLLNTWSLSVEEQFYIVFPALLLTGFVLARRSVRLRRAPVALVALLGAASLALALVTASGSANQVIPELIGGFYSPFTRAWEFAAGALLALGARKASEIGRRTALWAGVAGAALIMAGVFATGPQSVFPGPLTLLPVVGTALVLWAGFHQGNPISRVLSTRPLVSVGDLSYSWYLWHWPIIVFALTLWPQSEWVAVLAAAVSLVPSIISYRWVEQPIRFSAPTRRRLLGMVAVFTLIPLGASALLWWGAQRAWGSAEVSDINAALSVNYEANQRGCFSEYPQSPVGAWDPQLCTWNSGAPGAPIYLVGDSNALHFDAPLIEASAQTNRPLTIRTISGCPFVDIELVNFRDPERCAAFVDDTLQWLESSAPGTVFISAADFYWRDPSIGVRSLDGNATVDRASKISHYTRSLAEVSSALQAAGQEVVLVQSVPSFARIESGEKRQSIFGAGDCSLVQRWSGRPCAPVSLPDEDFDARQGDIWTAVSTMGERNGIRILDLRESICPGDACSAQRDNDWIYWDSTHLTPDFAGTLSTQFVESLSR